MTTRNSPPHGLLLVGHGTRNANGIAEFLQTAELVGARLPGLPVQPGFLELAEPGIAAALSSLVEQGVRQVVVMPLLLFAAGHAKRDIPFAVAQAAGQWPELSLVQASHLGCQQEILELSAQRFLEVVDAAYLPRETALVLAGRGSYDAQATSEMHRFKELRAQRTPAGKAVACFLAMAEPRLETALAQTTQEGWRRIVVQPHLLFQGELLDDFLAQTAAAKERWPLSEWLVAGHLGPSPLLAEAIGAIISNLKSQIPNIPNLKSERTHS